MTAIVTKVLLALDESESLNMVLEAAAPALKRLGAYELHVFRALDPSVVPSDENQRVTVLDTAHLRLARTAGEFVKKYGLSPTIAVSHVAIGSAAHQILQAASDLGIEMIFVGTHGRRGLSRLVIGSVAESVVRGAFCPVMVFPVEDTTEIVRKAVPQIDPPCPQCAAVRKATDGASLWCEQHAEAQERRHVYFQRDRIGSEPPPSGGLHL